MKEVVMTGLLALWLPILLSAVLVFVVSSLIHMASPWHKGDYPKLSSEDRVMDALRPLAIPPGDYMMPRPSSREEMRSPQFLEKFKKGPVLMLTVWPGGSMSMSRQLVQWFLYAVVVGCFAAYVAGRALPSRSPNRSTRSCDPIPLPRFSLPSTTASCGGRSTPPSIPPPSCEAGRCTCCIAPRT